MKTGIRGLAVGALFAVVACSGDGPAALEAFKAPAKPLPAFVGYGLVPDGASFRLGEEFRVQLVRNLSDGSRIPVLTSIDLGGDPTAPRVYFISFNPSVISLNSITGNAVAVGGGSARVEARMNNAVVASTLFTVQQPNGIVSGALVIHDFWIIELQYPSAPSTWYYAPQFRVSAAPGRTVTVLTLNLTIPGLEGSITHSCGGRIDATPTLLNGEVYGDWTFTVFNSASRATSERPTAVVTFVDDTGATGTVTLSGTVVQGSLPDTYTGGRNGGPCFHGYRG